MKLLSQSNKYLSIAILILMAIWSVVFYYSMLFAIKDSIDEELDNHKRLIIQRTLDDEVVTVKGEFDENLFTIQPVEKQTAMLAKDQYSDAQILMQDADDEVPELEPVRMLTTVFKVRDSYYQLKIVNPIVEQDDLVKALFWNVVGLYLLVLLSISIVNNFVLKRLWKPFYQFLTQLKQYRIRNSVPLHFSATNIKEFTDLQIAVGEMNRHTLNAYNQQKEFIENASHELQTPLAIACNKLELLLEGEHLSSDQASRITETYQLLQRLTKLNKSLLLLSQIDNKQKYGEDEICLNDLIHNYLDELSDFIGYKNIQVSIISNEQLLVRMDLLHASTLVSNLIRNAINHNIQDGQIEISVAKNQLLIANTGKSSPLDADAIFNRFHKDPGSTTGSGLGLAIAKAIAVLYKADLQYRFDSGRHIFLIIFQ